MREVKSTGASSSVQILKEKSECRFLHENSVPFVKKSSLHVSLKKTEVDPLSSLTQEEHDNRLATLGRQVGRLAHDIRNPLSSIEWFATLLGQTHHNAEERKELADHCIQAVRSLDHLVSNMLVFSAPLHTERESVDLLAILNDLELLAMYPLQQKRVTIHRHWKGQASTIHGHETLLKQGLLNLLMNAVHASEPGSSIEIHCRHESHLFVEQGKPCLKNGTALRIRDYGCGMSKKERAQMFRPFYSKRKGGTGLGLSIVKQIVHIHHGLIDITSQQGKGTTVDLFFPQ